MSLMSVTPLLCCLAWGKGCIYRKDREFGEKSIFTAWFFPESTSSSHWQYFKAFLSSVLFECWRCCSTDHTFQPLKSLPCFPPKENSDPNCFLALGHLFFLLLPRSLHSLLLGVCWHRMVTVLNAVYWWLVGSQAEMSPWLQLDSAGGQTDTSCKVLWQAELSQEGYNCYSRSQCTFNSLSLTTIQALLYSNQSKICNTNKKEASKQSFPPPAMHILTCK